MAILTLAILTLAILTMPRSPSRRNVLYCDHTNYGSTYSGSTYSGSTDSGSALLWQAGVPMEEAHQQLMDVLMPHTAARKADERCKQQDAEAAVRHAKL